MKKSLFFAAMAAVVLAGCSKNETSEIANPDNAIDFRPYVGLVRSTVVTGNTLPDGDFTVLGYYTQQADLKEGDNQNFMHDVVTKNGTSFTYANTKYWPSTDGDKVSFFAVYPKEAANIVVTPALKAAGLPAVAYTVGTIADQIDLMTASVPNQVKTATVTLPFTHALTKVSFQAKLKEAYANATVTLKSVKLAGKIAATGDYEAAADGTWAWTPAASPANVEYAPVLAASLSLDAAYKDILAADNDLLMIPQTFAADAASIEVAFEVKTLDSGLTFDVTKTIDVSTMTGINWTAGKAVTYQLELTLDAVNFDASVKDWE